MCVCVLRVGSPIKERHPEVFVEVAHPVAGDALLSGPPFEFGAASTDYAARSPLLGEHTRSVLAELGYGEAEVEELIGSGVVAATATAATAVGERGS